MTLNSNTSLRLGAVAAAALWTGWMIWSIGSREPADIVIFSICGVAFGYALYVALRFVLVHMRRVPGEER
jgi:hypothetical protein